MPRTIVYPSWELIQEALENNPSKTAAAKALGLPESTFRRYLKEQNVVAELPSQGLVLKSASASFDKDDNLKGRTVTVKAAPGPVFEMLPGHRIKGESAFLDPENRVLAKWVKTKEDAIGNGLVEALEAAFSKHEGAAPLVQPPTQTITELHTFYPLADLHLGMHSWGSETGEAYDVEIALERARIAYRSLVQRVLPTKTATLVILGDFLHANDQKNATPASGHQLDMDGRYPRVMEAAAELVLELADILQQKHEEIEIVILPGNHDPDAAAALRIAMRLYYRGHSRVKVDGSPAIAWYKLFGNTLIGATHGHTVKQADLPGMMAYDRKEDWGKSEHRSFFTAHIHHEKAITKGGVRVESFETLASRDSYSTNGGWRSGHSIQAITYHDEDGEVTRSRQNVIVRHHKREGDQL